MQASIALDITERMYIGDAEERARILLDSKCVINYLYFHRLAEINCTNPHLVQHINVTLF